ncbi:MAG: site-specific DNA-methyltransferase [Sphingomonadaceae bacterium]|nr:site-specific DNA-methyltransferase [Sphingomonadaceae bacterium]
MFPVSFARQVINDFSEKGDVVLDPFAGRGTSVFCAYEAGREGIGIEHNPLGWIYGNTKLRPAAENRVISRLIDLHFASVDNLVEADSLPEFFQICFSRSVRAFLITAREQLDWKRSVVDRTLMAFLLTYLHGKIGESGSPQSLSNQMRQTKALAPDYSVNWWRKHGYVIPPEIDIIDFMCSRIQWRYQKGFPKFDRSSIKLGDSRKVLKRISRPENGVRLLLTSPPYCGVTSYYYDQWLRFWLLGESERPSITGDEWKGKYDSKLSYRLLLHDTFISASRLLSEDATIYVRTDARKVTRDISIEVLSKIFPEKRLDVFEAPFTKPTQTHLFGDRSPKPGEVDLIMRPSR